MAPVTYRLQYWNKQGRAELARLILTVAGATWEEEVIDKRKDWSTLKPTKPFGQVPVLIELEDGQEVFTLAQSHAIERHLARTFNLAGATPREIAYLESIQESWIELALGWRKVRYAAPESKAQTLATFLSTVESTVGFHERLLAKNGSNGFYLGNKLTYVDLMAYIEIECYMAAEKDGVTGAIANAPAFRALLERVKNDPLVASYLSSPKRKPIS
ncbi:hypothetical protein HK101_009374 [Irineochytrium annulatum]|nr:hypothetical protein HK101_009374 [Irineochytrium annulatum]